MGDVLVLALSKTVLPIHRCLLASFWLFDRSTFFGREKLTLAWPQEECLRLTMCVYHDIFSSFHGAKSFPWRHDLFEDSLRAAGLTGVENGTKLFVSNLDIGVTNEDIRELFSEIGKLKRYAVHYDKNGRSSGSAEVVFARRSDAFRALKRYNSVQLDGKPMKVEIIGTHSEIPVSAHVNVVGGVNRRRRVVMMPGSRVRGSVAVNRGYGQRNRGDLMNGRGRGHGRTGGRGRGGGGRKKAVEKTYDELDKELENYHADAMHT
ncbi:hypothetical protein TEA_016267 [Camellia sinensis var. sinensis]|uniref:RRM domain-containing protein n=1 Tax=Camellia sinensis var. sinensis TaxID=542762 RepID=A0A4S4EV46_CAMSN|nr:hypothetical protein TEA_016267 [Camellia sinensis var. sinensis]